MFCHSYRQQPLPWKCFLHCSELNHELNGVISRTTIQTTQLHGLHERGKKKQQPSGDFGDVAQIKNCCGVTLLRINNSVCAYNYHRRKKQNYRFSHHRHIWTNTMLWKRLPSHHGDGQPATCVEREQKEGCHCLRMLRNMMEGPAAGKMAMLQRAKVTCTKGQWTVHSFVSVVTTCCASAFLIIAFQILYMMYVGSSRNKGP